jgi:hypothetical protein
VTLQPIINDKTSAGYEIVPEDQRIAACFFAVLISIQYVEAEKSKYSPNKRVKKHGLEG